MRIIKASEIGEAGDAFRGSPTEIITLYTEEQRTPEEISSICEVRLKSVLYWLGRAYGDIEQKDTPVRMEVSEVKKLFSPEDTRPITTVDGITRITSNPKKLDNFLSWFLKEKPDHKNKIALLDSWSRGVTVIYYYTRSYSNDSAVQYGPDTHYYDFYKDYMKSVTWKARSANMRLCGMCEHCEKAHSPKKLVVHHKTYENIGDEPDEDLSVLCLSCHWKRRYYP